MIVASLGGRASLWVAIVADVGTCLLVIFNGMTVLALAPKPKEDTCVADLYEHDRELALAEQAEAAALRESSFIEHSDARVQVNPRP